VESSAATPTSGCQLLQGESEKSTRTVDELLVLLSSTVGEVEFTIRSLCRAIALWKIVHDELNDLLLSGPQLLCQSVADESLDAGNLVNKKLRKRRVSHYEVALGVKR